MNFSAEDLFHRIVVTALKGAPNNKMKVIDLRTKAQIKRGITSVLEEMSARGLVSFDTPLTMETEVSLVHS